MRHLNLGNPGLTGTPGQSKSEIVKKIEKFLTEHNISVGVGDVEKELLDLYSPEDPIRCNPNRAPLVSLIGEKPQDEIKDKWPDAYKRAVEKARTDDPQVAIVVARLEYYRYETFEFYSPVDCGVVRDNPPDNILTVIDDIYDIYYRLSRPGQVFDIQLLQNLAFLAPRDTRDTGDLRLLYKDALNLVIGSLLRVLVWREKEIEAGADLGRTLGSKHAILAAKHPIETGVRLLLGKSSADFGLGTTYPVYVSHPISRPRRDSHREGRWPPFVDDLEDMITLLSHRPHEDCHVVPIMPTAIDEYRLLDDGTYLQPHLRDRWNIQDEGLLYCRPKEDRENKEVNNYGEYEARCLTTIFDPPIDGGGQRVGIPLSDPEISGALRVLKESIRLQMAGRDHLLVRQCPGFFLYRPVYGEHEFSKGVLAELKTFEQIRKYGEGKDDIERRIAFVHDCSDAEGLFEKDEQSGFPDVVRGAAGEVYRRAEQLAKQADKKHHRPPKDESIAATLQEHGDPARTMDQLHDDIFPTPQEGSIGTERPLDPAQTKVALRLAVIKERTKALASDVNRISLYHYCGNATNFTHRDPGQKQPDSYIEVAEDIDKPEVRKDSAKRVKTFFAGSNVEESQEESA